jgi:hypothetical protein
MEAMATQLVACVRAGEWTVAANVDAELHSTLCSALASVDATEAGVRRPLAASLARIKLGYDDAEREVEAARARLSTERSDAANVHRQIGRYLDTAAG